MEKRDKYLKKALKTFGLVWSDENELPLNTESDLDMLISDWKSKKIDLLQKIEDANEAVEKCDYAIDTFIKLKHQIKVEEYQELNPKHKIF